MQSLLTSGSLSSGQGKSVSTGRRAGKPNKTSNGENFVAEWTSVLMAKTALGSPSSQLSLSRTNAASLSMTTAFCRSTRPLVCGRSVVASVCVIPSDESVSRHAPEVKAVPYDVLGDPVAVYDLIGEEFNAWACCTGRDRLDEE